MTIHRIIELSNPPGTAHIQSESEQLSDAALAWIAQGEYGITETMTGFAVTANDIEGFELHFIGQAFYRMPLGARLDVIKTTVQQLLQTPCTTCQ